MRGEVDHDPFVKHARRDLDRRGPSPANRSGAPGAGREATSCPRRRRSPESAGSDSGCAQSLVAASDPTRCAPGPGCVVQEEPRTGCPHDACVPPRRHDRRVAGGGFDRRCRRGHRRRRRYGALGCEHAASAVANRGTTQRRIRPSCPTHRCVGYPRPDARPRCRLAPRRRCVRVAVVAVAWRASVGGDTTSSSIPAALDPGAVQPSGFASPSDPAVVAAARAKIKHIVFLDQGEPHVRHDVRDLPRRRRRHDRHDVRRADAAARPREGSHARRRAQLRRRHQRDQRRQDGLLQPDRVRAVPSGGHPELLALREAVHARRPVLLARSTGRPASSTCGRSPHSPTGSSITSARASSAPDGASSATTRPSSRSRCPVLDRAAQEHLYQLEEQGPNGAAQVADLLPATVAVHRTSRCCPIAWTPPGISWKEYRGENEWVQPLRMVEHVRFSQHVRQRRDAAGLPARTSRPARCRPCRG